MSFDVARDASEDGPSASPGGPFPSFGPSTVLPGEEELPRALATEEAIREGAPSETDENPATDEKLRALFLGSLGTNVTTDRVEKLKATHPCGASGGWFVSRETQRQWPARCKKLTCDYCLPREAAIRQLILSESMPDTMWSQTMAADAKDPDPWSVVHYRMSLFFHYYRRKAPMREMSYVVEMNPQRTGYHVHALCHGPHWKIDVLQDAQRKANLGLHGNQWQEIGKSHDAAGYGLKGFSAAGYGLKGYTAQGARQEALRINGGRLEHHTKGFIRVDGKPATLAKARAAVMLKKYGPRTTDAIWMAEPQYATWFSATEGMTPGHVQTLLDDL